MGALDFNNKDKDTEKYIHWKEVESNSGLRVNQAQIVKAKDDPPFSVALGAQVFSSGQHEFDFGITRHSDGYVYVGVAVPTLATDQTFCRKSANDQVWYYFGCGYTNALRNGYKDVVSKEVGGAEQKIPKLQPGDRIRLALDMDAGTLKFSIFRLEDPSWKELPGQIDGISQPVVAACCIQERGDAVTLSDSARMVVTQEAEGAMKKRVNKYAHIQSKLKEAGSLRHMIPQNEGGGENEDKENPNPEVTRKEKSKFRTQSCPTRAASLLNGIRANVKAHQHAQQQAQLASQPQELGAEGSDSSRTNDESQGSKQAMGSPRAIRTERTLGTKTSARRAKSLERDTRAGQRGAELPIPQEGSDPGQGAEQYTSLGSATFDMPSTPRQSRRSVQNQGMQGARNLKMPTIILAPPPAINWVPGGKSTKTKPSEVSSSKEGPPGTTDRTLPALLDALKSAGERRPDLVEKMANARVRSKGAKTPEEVKFGNVVMPPLSSKDALRDSAMGKAVVVAAGGLSIQSLSGSGGEIATGQLNSNSHHNGKGWAYTGKFKGSGRGSKARSGLSARENGSDGYAGEPNAPPRINSMGNLMGTDDHRGAGGAGPRRRSAGRPPADANMVLSTTPTVPADNFSARPPSRKTSDMETNRKVGEADGHSYPDRGVEGMDAIPIGIAAIALGSGLSG